MRLAVLVAFVALGACRRSSEEAPPTPCTKIGQTCKLGPGLLGVCNQVTPDTCAKPPCFVCTGQH